MGVKVGDIVKYHIEFIEEGVCIQRGKVCKIKDGFFTKKYLVESIKPTIFGNGSTRAQWIKDNTIIEIIKI